MKQLSTRFRRWRRQKKNDGSDSGVGSQSVSNRKRVSRPLLLRIVRIALGIVFLIIGFIGGFIPIFQGWLFVLIGLMLLSRDVPLVRRWFRRLRERFPSQMDTLKKWESKAVGKWRKFWNTRFSPRRRNRVQSHDQEKKER